MGLIITKLKQEIIEVLNLEDVEPDEIETRAPLFGEGLGLDSIDALELIVLLEKNYGIKIDDPKSQLWWTANCEPDFGQGARPCR